MPSSAILAYWERLPKMRAELSLALSEVISLPWMKDDAREKTIERWNDALGEEPVKKVPIPAILRMMGIGVEIVRK